MRGGKYNSGGGDSSNLTYDDSSFLLFAVAFLAVYWVPVFLFRFIRAIRKWRHVKTPLEEAKEAECVCAPCQQHADRRRDKRKGLAALSVSDYIFAVVTLLLLLSSLRLLRTNFTQDAPFDPFAILNVPQDATPRQIKKAYRRLSVVHHPDKNRGDPEAGERFIKITKAFSALTDEAAKENYIKYGNPDGYLGTTWGLGLPSWVAESRNSVLFAYAVFMTIIFPSLVGVWWHHRKKQLTSEVMTSTFMMYRETLQQSTRFRDLLSAFCGSDEFNDLYNSDNEDVVRELHETLRKAGIIDLRKAKSYVEPSLSQVQNLLVMTAYLSRTPIPNKLDYVLEGILTRSEPLLTALADTVGVFQRPDCKAAWDKTLMFGHTVYLMRCLQLTQCMNQALDEKSSPLLQVPHFTEREVKMVGGARGANSRTIYDLMRMDMEEMRRVLRDMNDQQLLDVRAFCERYPSATLEVDAPKVEGEDDCSVHEGDRVTVRVRLRVLRRSGSAFSPCIPRLPFRKEEVWWLWLADQRLMCPLGVRRLLPRMARGHGERQQRSSCCGEDDVDDWVENDAEDGDDAERAKQRNEEVERLAADPRVTVFDVGFQFMAPRAGTYTLEVRTACDCYSGASKAVTVRMEVKEAVEPPEEEPLDSDEAETDSDESESEEGSEEEKEETDGEYEYIEVTDSEAEEEEGEVQNEGSGATAAGGKRKNNTAEDSDDEDRCGITKGSSRGDPAA